MVKSIGVDKILIAVIVMLTLFGIIMVHNSTSILAKEKFGDSLYYFKRQIGWMVLGVIVMIFVTSLKKPFYLERNFVFFSMFAAISGLTAVFFTGKINNSFRWINRVRFHRLSIHRFWLQLIIFQIIQIFFVNHKYLKRMIKIR